MEEPTFRVVFKGDCSFDSDLHEVKQKISALLKVDQPKVERFFTGKAITLKNGVCREEALRLKTVFDRTGGISYIEPVVNKPASIVTWSSFSDATPPQSQAPPSLAFPVREEPFTCPKCGLEQEKTPSCAQCGVFFHKIPVSQAESRKGEGGVRDNTSSTSAPVMDEKEERKWAMACHLSALAGFVIPFGNVIGPLVVWISKKNGSEFVDEHGKTALNFQLTLSIFILGSLLVSIFSGFLLMILVPVIGILSIYNLIVIITSGAKANDGEYVEIMLSSRIIK